VKEELPDYRLSETESLRINAKGDKTFKRKFECIEEVNKFL
jgi:hypothetical protein